MLQCLLRVVVAYIASAYAQEACRVDLEAGKSVEATKRPADFWLEKILCIDCSPNDKSSQEILTKAAAEQAAASAPHDEPTTRPAETEVETADQHESPDGAHEGEEEEDGRADDGVVDSDATTMVLGS